MIHYFDRLSSITKFFWLLVVGNAVFIGCYFSGIKTLQQLVAPTINKANFRFEQMREFGALENTQNLLLLAIIITLAYGIKFSSTLPLKSFFAVGVGAFIFLLLEELDYGLHFYKLFSGELADKQYFSWHNQWDNNGLENATKLKRANDAINALWFFVIPLFFIGVKSSKITSTFIYKIIPNIWFPLGFIVAFICSKSAHQLDELGFGMINGVNGNLNATIAEFRETSIYYLYFLYAIQLYSLTNTETHPSNEQANRN